MLKTEREWKNRWGEEGIDRRKDLMKKEEKGKDSTEKGRGEKLKDAEIEGSDRNRERMTEEEIWIKKERGRGRKNKG